ncbi:MAG: CinA family protein [Steroidobacteraceae bacterium]
MSAPAAPDDTQLQALAARVGARLRATQRRVVTAESCTGGWIAKLFTDSAGSSQWFERGYVTYSNTAKQQDLQVPAALLQAQGAVSRAVVEAMVRGACVVTGAEVAVAVSGIAGPDGGTPDKPVGTVWIALALGAKIEARLLQASGSRDAIRRASVATALGWLEEWLA